MTLDTLISGHAKFRDYFDKHRGYWAGLVAEGQRPHVLWIGCSDSRVIPEQITGAKPGEMLVMRNVANVVPPYGTTGESAAAVFEFAITGLGVEHIIVCGHTYCGGVAVVLDPGRLAVTSPVGRWVSWIRPAVSQVEASGIPKDERYLEAIKANVVLQRGHVESYPDVSQAVKADRLSVHSWLFDIESGDLLAHDDATNTWRDISSHADKSASIT